MSFNPDIHHRRSIRLRDYDYSGAGAYFATICAWNRECLFGDVADGVMRLNNYGAAVDGCWQAITEHYPQVELDAFMLMPNHLHGIITIVGAQFIAPVNDIAPDSGMLPKPDKSKINQGAINHAPTVGEMIRGFKARCTHMINKMRDNPGGPVWQRNYHERVIRNDDEMARAREYIVNNPLKWDLDKENPVHLPFANPAA